MLASAPVFRASLAIKLLLVLCQPVAAAADEVPGGHVGVGSTWHCVTLSNVTLSRDVWWTKKNCTGEVEAPLGKTYVGPVVVNIAHALLSESAQSPLIRPAVAKTTLGLAKLHELALNASSEGEEGFVPLAGVNGG